MLTFIPLPELGYIVHYSLKLPQNMTRIFQVVSNFLAATSISISRLSIFAEKETDT